MQTGDQHRGQSDEAPAEDADAVASRDFLRVSLSGGGVRATLFAFGALLYLLDSGDHSRVRAISSVSGGSIANAILAVAGDYAEPESAAALRKRIGRASWMLATHGVFIVRRVQSYVTSVLVSAGLAAVSLIAIPLAVYLVFGGGERAVRFYANSIPLLAGIALLTLVYFAVYQFVVLLLFRRASQIGAYARAMSYAGTGLTKWASKQHRTAASAARKLKLSDLPASSITHVFCATDLVSGNPVFMTRERIQNETYGMGPADLAVSEAIYASAAFPAVFPPLAVSTSNWHVEGRQAERAARLFLSDGGVFNNLGTDWFAAAARVEDDGQDDLPLDSLIVNASKPPRIEGGKRTLIRFQVPALVRAMTVVQENTVSPRLRTLRDEPRTAIVDISQSPTALLEALESHPSELVRARAAAVAAGLRTPRWIDHWETLASATSIVPTQLEAVGLERTRHLLRHGYMNAAIAAHCVFGSAFTARDDRGEVWFAELLDEGSDSAPGGPAEQ